jgi:5-methyltetrahydrofolate corrinoid/iron sulfur protein methyltransferase
VGPEGLPRDENERAALCVELLYFANEAGIPNEKIWVDGIVTPVNIQQPQAISLMEFQKMLQDMPRAPSSTCGLSNISNGPPDHLRPILNQTYMVMLQKCGMESVISDPLDDQLTAIAKGKRQDIVDLIYGIPPCIPTPGWKYSTTSPLQNPEPLPICGKRLFLWNV